MTRIALAALMLFALGCDTDRPTEPADPAATGPDALPRQEPANLALGPIETFEDACARCHGPEGSFYGEAFASMPDEELHEIVREMMVGPAFLSPSEPEVDAMAAYHRALAAGEPFICVTNAVAEGDDATLRGEVSPGATLSVDPEGPITREPGEIHWSMPAPAGAVTFTASQEQSSAVELPYPALLWTHRSP